MSSSILKRLSAAEQKPAPFPIDELGEILAAVANGLINAHQVPPAMCAQALLTTASFAAASVAQLEHDGIPSGCCLFALTAAESGTGKTTVSRTVMAPIKSFEEELNKRHKTEWAKYCAALDLYERKMQCAAEAASSSSQGEVEAHDSRRPTQPLGPPIVLHYTDPTMEGMNEALRNGHGLALLHNDEAGTLIKGFGMGNSNRIKFIAMLSNLWDRRLSDYIRAKHSPRGGSEAQVAIHLMAQPRIMIPVLADKDVEDQGFLNRSLIHDVPPKASLPRYVKRTPVSGHETAAYNARMLNILRQSPLFHSTRESLKALRTIALSDLGHPLYAEYYNKLVEQHESTGCYEAILPFIKRAAEIALRIAGVLTIIDDPHATEIPADAFRRATRILDWFIQERIRISSQQTQSQTAVNADKIWRYLVRNKKKTFNVKDIYRGPIREGVDVATQALTLLEKHQYIRKTQGDGRRSKTDYAVIPQKE